MSRSTILHFTSRYCKLDKHQNCDMVWSGFGFGISCRCDCHKKSKTSKGEEKRKMKANKIYSYTLVKGWSQY